MTALINGLVESPVWLVDTLYNAQAWNRAASVVWRDLSTVSRKDRNLLWLWYTDTMVQARHADWQADAGRLMAALRARAAENKDDPRFGNLIDRLKASSPPFRAGWPRHDVTYPPARTMNMRHPQAGDLKFLATAVLPEAAPGARLLVWTPDPSGNTAELVRRLVSTNASVQ